MQPANSHVTALLVCGGHAFARALKSGCSWCTNAAGRSAYLCLCLAGDRERMALCPAPCAAASGAGAAEGCAGGYAGCFSLCCGSEPAGKQGRLQQLPGVPWVVTVEGQQAGQTRAASKPANATPGQSWQAGPWSSPQTCKIITVASSASPA